MTHLRAWCRDRIDADESEVPFPVPFSCTFFLGADLGPLLTNVNPSVSNLFPVEWKYMELKKGS